MRTLSAAVVLLAACTPGGDDGSWTYVTDHPESRTREFQTEHMICVVWMPRGPATRLSRARRSEPVATHESRSSVG